MKIIITLFIWALYFIFMKFLWNKIFSPKKKMKKTALMSLQEQQKNFNLQKERQETFRARSNFFNKFPILRLDEEKRNYWESCINQKCGLLSLNKPLPEELHCTQWTFVLSLSAFLLIVGIFGGILIDKLCYAFLLLLFALPHIATMAISEYVEESHEDEENILSKHFLSFFEDYYTQYQVQKPSLELPAMLQGYSETCHPDMLKFVSVFFSDVQTVGPEQAIQLLVKRYENSDIIRRFGALASAVQSQTEGAEIEVSEFLDYLQTEKFLKEEQQLEKATARIDTEIQVFTMGLLGSLMVVALVCMFKTLT